MGPIIGSYGGTIPGPVTFTRPHVLALFPAGSTVLDQTPAGTGGLDSITLAPAAENPVSAFTNLLRRYR